MEKLLTYKKINEIFPKLIRILNKANQKNILFDCSFNTECKFMLPVEQFKKKLEKFSTIRKGNKSVYSFSPVGCFQSTRLPNTKIKLLKKRKKQIY